MAHKWPGSRRRRLRERQGSEASEGEAKDKVREDGQKKKMMHKNATKDLCYLKRYYKIFCFS